MRHSLLTFALALCFTPVAFAQEEEGAPPPSDEVESAGLEEKKPKAEKSETADPDSAMATKIETRRTEIQTLLNQLQEDVGNRATELTVKEAKVYDKIVNEAGKLVAGFITENEKFLEKHRALIESYQGAHDSNKVDEMAKIAKETAKLRGTLHKSLDKLTVGAAKVRKNWDDFVAAVKKNLEK